MSSLPNPCGASAQRQAVLFARLLPSVTVRGTLNIDANGNMNMDMSRVVRDGKAGG